MKAYSKLYNELNDRQKQAVDNTEGPLLILAGPGTGKTQLLSVRAAAIIEQGKTSPENILIVTYTNAAAKAMKERLAAVIGLAGYDIEVGTFHSFANKLISESEEAAEYIGDKVQLDEVERMRAMEYILDNTDGLDEIRPFRAPYTYLKEILQRISDLKRDGILPGDLRKYLEGKDSLYRDFEDKYIKRLKAFAIAYGRYEELKEGEEKGVFDERGRYDFDDMILFATEVLKEEPAIKKMYQEQYKYVMVDEYQDTNGSQMELLFHLLDYKNPNILCVGDDDQSIYRFQGANIGNFKLFTARFPGVKTLSLKDNYRSAKELIDISAKVIGLIPPADRMGPKELAAKKNYPGKEILFKEFTAVEEELLFIIDKVKELKEVIEKDKTLTKEERSNPYNNIAVLVRKRADILKIIDAFLQAGIPYATDGKEDISGEKRVRQMLDLLELARSDASAHRQKDLALYKILSADYFEIPQSDILRFLNFVNARSADRALDPTTILTEFLDYCESGKSTVKFKDPARFRKAAEAIAHLLRDSATRSAHALLIDFIKEAGVFGYILREYSTNAILRIRQLRGLSSFVNMIKASDIANPGMKLEDLMAEIKTRKDHGLPIQGELVTLSQSGVRIYTAHGAKGMEFHTVIIPFCLNNKNWPARPIPDKIKLPSDLFKGRLSIRDKDEARNLALQDETRLFYVAMTRAKSNLIFTASPTEDSISSQYLDRIDIVKEPAAGTDEEKVMGKSLEATDLTDPFVGTEEVLKDIVGVLSLNPTRLNTYITCGRKFLYNDLLKLPGPKKKSLVFGNCTHKALEDTYKKFMDAKKFPTFKFFLDSFRHELKFQGVDDITVRDCLKKADTFKGWFDLAAKDPVMPVSLERKLIVTIGENIIFTGKYDKVEFEDEKKGVIKLVDYKTGKPDKHLRDIDKVRDLSSPDCDGYLRQLVCYRLLFEKDKKESRGRRVRSGELVFLEPVSMDMRQAGYKKGQYATKRVEISDEMVSSVEALIKVVWGRIKALDFRKLPSRDDYTCGHCDFDSICWE
ncbi:MAG: ATP-dependent DNA helicase [Candidatus Omnitrophica bacterium]|nr:ATP-dependent DNA helicase [Candidatus Omnitrophota bacterium]